MSATLYLIQDGKARLVIRTSSGADITTQGRIADLALRPLLSLLPIVEPPALKDIHPSAGVYVITRMSNTEYVLRHMAPRGSRLIMITNLEELIKYVGISSALPSMAQYAIADPGAVSPSFAATAESRAEPAPPASSSMPSPMPKQPRLPLPTVPPLSHPNPTSSLAASPLQSIAPEANPVRTNPPKEPVLPLSSSAHVPPLSSSAHVPPLSSSAHVPPLPPVANIAKTPALVANSPPFGTLLPAKPISPAAAAKQPERAESPPCLSGGDAPLPPPGRPSPPLLQELSKSFAKVAQRGRPRGKSAPRALLPAPIAVEPISTRTRNRTGVPVRPPKRLVDCMHDTDGSPAASIDLTGSDNEEDEPEDAFDESPRGKRRVSTPDFIVPDDAVSDDDGDAGPPSPMLNLSDDDEADPVRIFQRLRKNNVDERVAFGEYMDLLVNEKEIPADASALRRVADYPLQLAKSITHSGAWSEDLMADIHRALDLSVRPMRCTIEGRCSVCMRKRTLSQVVTIQWWDGKNHRNTEYFCGPCCAERVQTYFDLIQLKSKMLSHFIIGSPTAVDECWEMRRTAIQRAMKFAADANE